MAAEARSGEARAGTIYDLGYRRYDGERLGRVHAIRTLVVHGLRSAFGIGRSDRAKVFPFLLTGAALLPAIGDAMAASATGNLLRLVEYETYLGRIEFILLLFCAAQAPELISSDRKYRVLPLYHSRPIERDDYVASKIAALVLAVGGIVLLGQSVLFGTRVFAAGDALAGWSEQSGALLPLLTSSVIAALILATVALAVASFIESRARATAAVVGLFMASGAASQLLFRALPDSVAPYSVLLNPFHVLTGITLWLFDASPQRRTLLARADLPGSLYLIAALVIIATTVAILVIHHRRLRA